MLQTIPPYISIAFGGIVLVTIWWFYKASASKTLLYIVLGWTLLQCILGLNNVYLDTKTMPPKIMVFGIFPTILMMILAFRTTKEKQLIDAFNLKTLTYFHSIRIPVEIVLALLYYQGAVSVLMTFEGTNFDILSGLTAPLVAYFAFKKGYLNNTLLFWWNIICLLLLINVVITAIFAFPSPFQKLAFDQPNIAILYFPFNLLPTVVVPLVLFGRFVAFRQLKN